MNKLLLILKEDLLDKKWFLLGLGVLVGLLSCYVVYLISTWDLSSLQAYLQSLPESYRALLGQPDVANPYSFLKWVLLFFPVAVLRRFSYLLSEQFGASGGRKQHFRPCAV